VIRDPLYFLVAGIFLVFIVGGCFVTGTAGIAAVAYYQQLEPTEEPRPLSANSVEPSQKGESFVNGRVHGDIEIAADMPGELMFENIPSLKDRAGMCVTTSIEMAGLHQSVPGIKGFRDWCAKEAGGANSEKVERQIREYYRHKAMPVPPYIQYEGSDPESLLNKINMTGRMGCITYGYSPRYKDKIGNTLPVIYHMVCFVKYGNRFGVVLDNNFVKPAETTYEWMAHTEFLRRAKHPSGKAWIFVWLDPAPPAPIWN